MIDYNPFTRKQIQYEDGEPQYDNSQRHEPDRYLDTQKEWIYNQYQMRLMETLDRSEKIQLHLLCKLHEIGIDIQADDTVESFLDKIPTEILTMINIGESQE